MKTLRYVILVKLLLTILITDAASQIQWISLDGSDSGKEYSLEIRESNTNMHLIKVRLHGFYDLLIEKDGKRFHKLHTLQGFTKGEVGEPQFISIPQLIAIPDGARYTIKIEDEIWTDVDMGTLYPAQNQHLETEPEPEFTINDNVYQQEVYSPSILSIGKEYNWRNLKNIPVSICPFRYYPTKDKLSVMSSFVLHIDFEDTSKTSMVEAKDILQASKWHMFDNRIDGFPTKSREPESSKSLSSATNYDYLIIVGDIPDILNSQALKDFVKWKAFKGYKTKIVSTTNIGTSQSSIKNYINQEYSNGIRYVLFIGDNDKIPMAYANNPWNQLVRSDYWYGCYNGDYDFEAEIPVGRFSTNSLSEFQNMVDKTINYESAFDGYYDETLLVAHYEDAPGKYQGCCDAIINESYSNSFTFNIAYGSSIINGGLESTNEDVINIINSKMHIVNYRGHGWQDSWGDIYEPWNVNNERFYDTEISSINQSSIYFNICCLSGDIETSSCFMETFTRAQKGAIACIAANRLSHTDSNNILNKKLYSKLLNDDVWHIGDLNLQAHIATFSSANEDDANDNALMYMCGGDPTLEIWTDTPTEFNNVNISVSGGNLIVSCPSFCSTDSISVVSGNGELLNRYSFSGNNFTIPFPAEEFYISVNRHNYYPYIVFCSSSNYIQNKTITTNAFYFNNPLDIGYDVTNDESYGNVTIKDKNGLRIMNGSQGVSIKNGFNCEKGAELHIE